MREASTTSSEKKMVYPGPFFCRLGCVSAVLTGLVLVSAPAFAGTWTKLDHGSPNGDWPANVALLTDGRILIDSGASCGTSWWTLSPDSNGSYVHQTWTAVGSSVIGRHFNPSAVLRSGSYLICGGEDVSNHGCGDNVDDAECEIFDPVHNTWSTVSAMPDRVRDTPATVMADGRVIFKAFDTLGDGTSPVYIFDERNVSAPGGPWTRVANLPNADGDSEDGSVLLPDGSVFMGGNQLNAADNFARYLPDVDSWQQTATPPNGGFSNGGSDEIGAFVLLHDGRALVLGANSQNGLYTFPATWTGAGSWQLAANTPFNDLGQPLIHGDAPACVEPDGKVLTAVDTSAGGDSPPWSFYEYDPANDVWGDALNPESFTDPNDGSNRFRFLALPKGSMNTGQILVSGWSNGDMWLYTPAGTPQTAWKPTITSITPLTFGSFVLSGTQLNGLTSGADFGDDGKMATNYPVVSLVDGAGHITFVRTFGVDQMAPRPSLHGVCSFKVPSGMTAGTYMVHVSANGVDSSNTWSLSLPNIEIGPAEVSTETALLL